MTIRDVCIRYGYTYAEPISDLRHRLVVVPPDRYGSQIVREHALDVRCDGGAVTVSGERDGFGNRVHRILAPRVEGSIEFEARYRVEQAAPLHNTWDLRRYLSATPLTAPDARLREAAQAVRSAAGPGAAAPALAERAHDWAASALSWQFGITTDWTPAAAALEIGKGVCQDHAHILLTVLRLLEIPRGTLTYSKVISA